ncbi:transposase family protein [Streptomyces sp. NPDC005799]|uniref:helix-turn-helix domain-containing protein n=1 Tax=Streptomyces sp. NPDC005799 TaxID=3154678 RepID=UPI0033CD187A
MITELVSEIGLLWHAQHQATLASRPRQRAVGAGAEHKLVFVDRLLATLIHLRHRATHDVLACWFDVNRSTITRAIAEVRPLLAQRGCTIAPGRRLRTLAEVVDHLGENEQTGIIDGTEIRVRRPAAGCKDRDKYIKDSGQVHSRGRTTRGRTTRGRTSRTPSSPWSSPTLTAASCTAARLSPRAVRTSLMPAS